jgi:hypothetical protein
MSRQVLTWLVVADTAFLLAAVWLVGGGVLPERQAALLILPVLFISNFVVVMLASRREQSSRTLQPMSRVGWVSVWICVWLFSVSAVINLTRFVTAPSRVTAVVAVVDTALAVYLWWVVLKIKRKRQLADTGA